MKVKDFIEKLSKLNPEAEVVYSGFDHSYSRVTRLTSTKAENWHDDLTEYYDEGSRLSNNSKIIDVIVLE